MNPKHCKGCLSFHNEGHKNPTKELKRFNAWCCANGAPAIDSIGRCKLNKLKRIK